MSGVKRRRRGRLGIAVAAVLVTGGAVAAAAGLGFVPALGGDDRGGDGVGPLPPATAQVSRQTLVDTQTEDGELGHGPATTVSARLAGTVTALPAPGSTVNRGQPICRIDNRPVVLLYGSLPAYRVLRTGVEGTDVEQFEQNLKALGYSGFTVDDEYSDSTASAVKKWQEDLGLPETGTVELGRVVYAAGAVRVDEQKAAVGDAVQPGTALLTHTGTARVVTVDLDVADQRLAKKGAPVKVKLPGGSTSGGKIGKTRTVVDASGGEGGQEEPETKIEVTISLDDAKAMAGLGQAAVKVDFTASERKDVLTVPVAALLALAEGGYGVQVVEGAATRIVAVETGLFASGRVEVSGDGLTEGMTVGIPA
ncbi:efflux RND transporter periplasmic adaptor subunit [Micromonospora sp. KC723]|uniref:efflux RND transporter periplasmic adaptor subunit n=1 Tax=Micromonospora sp. KC723 TaxID=2530381 RepID=UPI001049FC3A|nr:peptidoglycan-binding protein [Micromonospora sp. KC723]TDB73226.1 HlyD family efflux transporter periplasmic adaptor subunit [Micromonospora sp. KC723]